MICNRDALLPTSLQIPFTYDPTELPQYAGTFGAVWKGECGGEAVAVKVLKLTLDVEVIRKVCCPKLARLSTNRPGPIQRFCKEAMTWKILSHPNVLPLICASMNGGEFVMVSEWMDNGNVVDYLKRKDADRLKLVTFSLSGTSAYR